MGVDSLNENLDIVEMGRFFQVVFAEGCSYTGAFPDHDRKMSLTRWMCTQGASTPQCG